MEKASPRRRTKKTNLICIPGLKTNYSSATFKNTINRVSPMSLLERFREAVFRLMMLSALSKATHNAGSSSSSSSPNNHHGVVKRSYYHHPADDPHHSEAVADCIEFIKKTTLSSSDDDSGRDSTASSSTTRTSNSSVDHSSPELVFPVPIM